jgi:hypothetical protein
MILTTDYRPVLAVFQSDLRFSREPLRGRFSQDYFFRIGPLEYTVSFWLHSRDSYSMSFQPVQFYGSFQDKIDFYEQVTGQEVSEDRVNYLLEDWFASENSFQLLRTGSAFKVLSNVLNIIEQFIKEKESSGTGVKCLQFMADKEEASRLSLYDKLISIYKNRGFVGSHVPMGKYIEYWVCDPEHTEKSTEGSTV